MARISTRLVTTLTVLLLFAFTGAFTACEPKSSVDHYAIAKAEEAKLKVPGDYGDPAYEGISQELMLVQTGDDAYASAQAWLHQIQEGRKAAVFRRNQAPEVQEGGYHPSLPEAGGGGDGKPAGSMTAAGWMPYNDVNVGGSGGGSKPSSGTAARASSGSKCKSGPITLYGTSWCGVCAEARAYFRKNGIAFADKDIEADPSAAAELRRKAPGASGVPVIDVAGDIMPGFSASAMDAKLCL